MGQTGLSCARYLHAHGIEFAVVDSRDVPPAIEQLKLECPEVPVLTGGFHEREITTADCLMVSPGVSLREASIARAIDAGKVVFGDIEMFAGVASAPVVAVTGSNGKTSTKDFTLSVIGQRYQVHATKGNLNNHIGLPLTVLETDDDDDVLVVEMGMNHSGEIAPLCEIAQPHIGIITNIGYAHIEFMGSREAIAEEKGALARSLPEVGTLLVTAGCEFANYFGARSHARSVSVGNGRGVIRAEGLQLTEAGSEFELVIDGEESSHVQLAVAGKHMVNNALLAAGAGWVLGLAPEELACGLEAAQLSSGRLRCFDHGGITVYDDTYNANPDSMRAAIGVVAGLATSNGSARTVVLGTMGELGCFSEEMHHQVGAYAAQRSLRVVSVGAEAAGIAEGAREGGAPEVEHFDQYEDAARWLRETLQVGDVILFKGSRAAAVERVMNQVFPENEN